MYHVRACGWRSGCLFVCENYRYEHQSIWHACRCMCVRETVCACLACVRVCGRMCMCVCVRVPDKQEHAWSILIQCTLFCLATLCIVLLSLVRLLIHCKLACACSSLPFPGILRSSILLILPRYSTFFIILLASCSDV